MNHETARNVVLNSLGLILLLAIAIAGLVWTTGCSKGEEGEEASGLSAAAPTVDVSVEPACTTFVTYPSGRHSITPNPRLGDLIPCAMRSCVVAGVCYYGCPPELIDDRCPGAR